MRVTIDGSGNILTHGDSLSGGGVIEFPVNELPGFPSGWTVSGSAPSRKLLFQGHEMAVETPTAEAEAAPSVTAAPSLPTVIVVDTTGGTFRNGNSIDPTPVTSYTVARDDLGAAANPADYPHLPAGTYLVGGYVDFTYVTPPSTGAVTADISAASTGPLYPEGDLGVVGDYIPIADAGNYIFAPTKLVTVAANTPIDLYVRSFGLDQDLTWVKWVFWAVQVATA